MFDLFSFSIVVMSIFGLLRYLYSPVVPGHEFIGHVAAIGDNVSQWKIGDRIGGPWHGGHDGMLF